MKVELLTHNLWMKLGALLLAVALWFYVAGEERVEAELKIPVQLSLAEGMVVTEQDTTELELLVRGRKEVISRLAEKELLSRIDFGGHTEPEKIIFHVERENIPVSAEITVLRIVPTKLVVKIDKLAEKVLPVQVLTEGTPAPEYKLEGFALDPVSALVKGPEGYLKDLEYIKTESIDITGRRKSFKKMVPLEPTPIIGEKMPPQFVEVVIRIGKETESTR